MKNIVRLSGISLINFKNVERGDIDLSWNEDSTLKGTSVLGIYGQNGSGKTAVIEALEIIKRLLEGSSIGAAPHEKNHDYAPYIKADCESCAITACFAFSWENTTGDAIYKVEISKVKKENSSGDIELHPLIIKESLDVRYCGERGAKKLHRVMECNFLEQAVLLPTSRLREITGNKETIEANLIGNKAVCKELAKSFIFFDKNRPVFQNTNDSRDYTLIKIITEYAKRNLFVISDPLASLVGLGTLPFAFKTEKVIGSFPVFLANTTIVPNDIFDALKESMKKINLVLEALVPGLTIEVNDIAANKTSEHGIKGHEIELLSKRDELLVPLSAESRGIRKLISILQLLITACNSNTVTVAVDELDAGIYEYLFGEIVQVLQDHCLGQIIFTSHNLRPLEILDRRSICFTTANPKRRYIKMKGIHGSNNMRDLYLRALKLGGMEEPLAHDTDKYKLAFALTQPDETDEKQD